VKDDIHQADLLFLPTDKGHKYALTVVDVASRNVDAVPLKDKSAASVKSGFQKIYNRGILHCKNNHVGIRRGLPDRHHSQALIERQNQTIGDALFFRQNAQELLVSSDI